MCHTLGQGNGAPVFLSIPLSTKLLTFAVCFPLLPWHVWSLTVRGVTPQAMWCRTVVLHMEAIASRKQTIASVL